MCKKINLEELFDNNFDCYTTALINWKEVDEPAISKDKFKELCLNFGQQLLELAYEKSKIDVLKSEDIETKGWYILNDKNRLVKDQLNDLYCYSINKQSILDTINQIK
jgi:hypothetical protein